MNKDLNSKIKRLKLLSVAIAILFSACMQSMQRNDNTSIISGSEKADVNDEVHLPVSVPAAAPQDADLLKIDAIIQQKIEELRFKNEIAIPSTLYLMDNLQNDLFVKPIIKRWRPYDDYVVFSLNKGDFYRRLSTVVSIKKPENKSVLSVKLINSDEFKTIKELKTELRVSSSEVDNGTVYAQIIGDSYTQGGFYVSALIRNNLVPNLKMVGLRKRKEDIYDEGRGGWRLSSYFSVPKGLSYHAFMHPEGDYRYWGSRDFWITAHLCAKNEQPQRFEPGYSCSRYDDYIDLFDEKTGLLVNPQLGDVQYDNAKECFLVFNGKEWIEAKDEFNWAFDYGKYLSMFHFHAPDFVFVELGLNDFRSSRQSEEDYLLWEKRFMQMHKSILKENEKCKIAICIPCSTCGSIDNSQGAFTPKQDAAMWEFRSWLIKNFDHREKESIYLLDTGICIDSEYGYNYSTDKELTAPFYDFDNPSMDVRIPIQTGNPHPYKSYPQMGIPLAAFIQYYRPEIKRADESK